MTEITQIKLDSSAILNVPLHIYSQDFTLIVNQEEFHTTKIISDLLSPKICQIHTVDPTFNSYTIKTTNQGHFSYILDLFKFESESIPQNELPFISEILENFQNNKISITLPKREQEITLDNIIDLIKLHESNQYFYVQYLSEEIDFITKHFYELTEEQEEKLHELSIDTLEKILSHNEIQLRDENQILNFLNHLYESDSKYSKLYKFVYFTFVDEQKIKEFIQIFDINDITTEIWSSISNRLKEKLDVKSQKIDHIDHYENHYYSQLAGKKICL